jgi:CubicO group peptidase (beta-lactamase class C family)
MIYLKKTSLIVILLIAISSISYAQNLAEKFDKMLSEQYLPDDPGATALVAIDGKIIYHKAFGMANLELDVPMKTDMVFEIGSITKQFTAVSILMLMEQGKLSLDDDITKFIEDYPTHGKHISIHHLLTHTSGIKSYTSMDSWASIWRKDMQPNELIDFFKNEPMDFNPGEEWRYNNSAYIILGYIIEKTSGKTYEQFLEEDIFAPLGMNSSSYGCQFEIIKNRAYGYQKTDKYINAEYLSLTQPYAAGSIMSTVNDLFIWNRAIRSNKLVKKETIELAFTNYKLNNGEKTNYGYGWELNEINGNPTIEHAGGIFGFVTNSIYLPDEDVFVAIFSNCDCNDPGNVSTRMAALAINKPYHNNTEQVILDADYLQKFVGVYDFEDGSSRIITLENNKLNSQRTGGGKFEMFAANKKLFCFEDSFATLEFNEDGNKIKAVFTNRNTKTEGVKTDKEIPSYNEIKLSEEILKRYTGIFELQPGFNITISLENGKLMTQATGQEKFELFAEAQTKFFLKVVDAHLEFFENETGEYERFVLYQGGQEFSCEKKK